jgi:hypothetical protein
MFSRHAPSAARPSLHGNPTFVGGGCDFTIYEPSLYLVDTAATFALGLSIPFEWDGVPVYEAFGLPVEEESKGCSKRQ